MLCYVMRSEAPAHHFFDVLIWTVTKESSKTFFFPFIGLLIFLKKAKQQLEVQLHNAIIKPH